MNEFAMLSLIENFRAQGLDVELRHDAAGRPIMHLGENSTNKGLMADLLKTVMQYPSEETKARN